MKTNRETTVAATPLYKAEEAQSEFDHIQNITEDDQAMSEDEVKFIGEFGWLTAAAVLVASIAAGV